MNMKFPAKLTENKIISKYLRLSFELPVTKGVLEKFGLENACEVWIIIKKKKDLKWKKK